MELGYVWTHAAAMAALAEPLPAGPTLPGPVGLTPRPPRVARRGTHQRDGLRPGSVRRLVRFASRTLSSVVLLVTVVLFAGLAIGPHLFGYRTETMLTASMRPTIAPGDVAVDTPEPLTAIRAGQIITYQIPTSDHRVVSHRVIAVTRTPDGGVTVHTKGDANTTPDQWTAQLHGQKAWQVRAVIPHLGQLINPLRHLNVVWLLRAGAALFALDVLISIWRRPPPTPTHHG